MATFIYPVVMDLVVLMLAAYKLVIQSRSYHRSRLMKLLFQDGFIYFIIVSGSQTHVFSIVTHKTRSNRFVVNVPTAVIAYLQLNPILYVLFGLPAATLTVIASCRAVRRLTNFSSEKPSIHMTTSTGGIGGLRNFPPISFKFTRPGNSDHTSLLPVVGTVPGSSTSKNSGTCVEKSDTDEI
ncbi:hypothetical protein NLI96_g3609 [Meripilus lineatus]|uniref:Uncharacterized protein n=1 Tax=Meripilus lineatus TaxID=2056292 RepID=A0AAD5V6G0_9APHY|nr:hypothetical protein NLI96_g3609 [Physisporinus lineatus]